jgi:hypothetical protein
MYLSIRRIMTFSIGKVLVSDDALLEEDGWRGVVM